MIRCPRCRLRREVCMCAEIPRVATRTRVLILRHSLERKKHSNSGRIAMLALDNAELRDYGGLSPAAIEDLGADGDALLYPDGPPWAGPPPRRLIVLDATWSQARRMRHRIAALRGIPVLALSHAPAAARLRRAPGPGRMATLEAIAAAIGALEGDATAAPLLAVYDELVRRSRRTGHFPND